MTQPLFLDFRSLLMVLRNFYFGNGVPNGTCNGNANVEVPIIFFSNGTFGLSKWKCYETLILGKLFTILLTNLTEMYIYIIFSLTHAFK